MATENQASDLVSDQLDKRLTEGLNKVPWTSEEKKKLAFLELRHKMVVARTKGVFIAEVDARDGPVEIMTIDEAIKKFLILHPDWIVSYTVEADDWTFDQRSGMVAVYQGPKLNCLSGIDDSPTCVYSKCFDRAEGIGNFVEDHIAIARAKAIAQLPALIRAAKNILKTENSATWGQLRSALRDAGVEVE